MNKAQKKLKETMELKEIAEIQAVYSQLYLSGQVSGDTYRAVVNATMLSMNRMEDISEDMRCLDRVKKLLPIVKEKANEST